MNLDLIMMDILVKRQGKWYAYEVKSSTKISDTYLTDAAIQYYVITNSGLVLEDISIVHINNQYVKGDTLDLSKFFKTKSVKERILEIQPDINRQVNEMKAVIFGGNIPGREIGKHCFSPYPCDYIGYCWKDGKDAEIFTLAGMGKEKNTCKNSSQRHGKGVNSTLCQTQSNTRFCLQKR